MEAYKASGWQMKCWKNKQALQLIELKTTTTQVG